MSKKKADEKVIGERLSFIIEKIRSGSYPNTKKLAEDWEVNSRTIARDIDYINNTYDTYDTDGKKLIKYDHKKRGYYFTKPNFSVRNVLLTDEEIENIIIFDDIIKNSPYKQDSLIVRIRKLIDKVLIALPEEQTNSIQFRPTADRIPRFLFRPDWLFRYEVIAAISKAITNKEVIEIEYWTSNNRKYTKKEIKPLKLYSLKEHSSRLLDDRSRPYVLAYNKGNHDKPGIYSATKIRSVKRTRKKFKIPANFKVSDYISSDYIKEKTDVFPADNKEYNFEFSFPKEIASEALEKVYHHNQHIQQCKDGTVNVSFKSTDFQEVYYWVLSEGHKVKVLNPPELVNKIKFEAQKVVQYYTNNKDNSKPLINKNKK